MPFFQVRFQTIIVACLSVVAIAQGELTRTRAADIDAATVQQAIDRGVAFLRSTQDNRGNWKEHVGQNGGLSALCTLALLTAGVPVDDPAIQKALAYLRKLEPTETYSVALQTLVFCQVGAASDLVRIQRNVEWLESEQTGGEDKNSFRVGGWGYGGGRGGGDPSNSQFALLALDAAEQRGVKVSPLVFQRAAQYWNLRQTTGGAWSYSTTQSPTGSMTCAGIASTVICRGRVSDSASKIKGQMIECCGGETAARDAVEAGLDWLGERFSVQVNPGNSGSTTLFYYLYALERVGRMTGRRFIGGHDWYREGAQRLVALQDGFQGFWSGVGFAEDDRNVTTSFALLFLAKGKRQVVIGRLRHGAEPDREDGQWNAHPDASRQLIRRLERNWGRELTWQTMLTDQAKVEDLLQAPLIVISGTAALNWNQEVKALLKSYVDQGGSILFDANASAGCGPATGFEQSVRQLCNEWFEAAPLTPLPPNHPVYIAEGDVKPNLIAQDYQLYGVEACCRTAVFYSPLTLTCRWELSDPTGRNAGQDVPQAVKDSIETSARLGQNLLAYVTGRELRDKLDVPLVIRNVQESQSRRGATRIGKLQLDAGGREARRAIPNFVAIASTRVPLRLEASTEQLPIDSKSLAEQSIIWMHGRTDFTLSEAQRQTLRDYLRTGGLIIADSICASPEFTAAFRREMASILPDSPLQPVSPEHPVLTDQFGGYDLRNVTLRTPARGGAGLTVNRRQSIPQLEIATVDDVAAVFFSPLDLSCALESQNSIQCPGYDTQDATRIGVNLVLFLLQQ